MIQKAIICVDDEKIVLSSLVEQLENHFGDHYLYESAENGKEAFELIDELTREKMKIILIVSDWLMPGIKGDELLIGIHKKYPNIITIMLTGHADDNAIKNAEKNANLFACIHKPWDEKLLIETIKNATAVLNNDHSA